MMLRLFIQVTKKVVMLDRMAMKGNRSSMKMENIQRRFPQFVFYFNLLSFGLSLLSFYFSLWLAFCIIFYLFLLFFLLYQKNLYFFQFVNNILSIIFLLLQEKKGNQESCPMRGKVIKVYHYITMQFIKLEIQDFNKILDYDSFGAVIAFLLDMIA